MRALQAHVTDAIETARTSLQLPSLALRAITGVHISHYGARSLIPGWGGSVPAVPSLRRGRDPPAYCGVARRSFAVTVMSIA